MTSKERIDIKISLLKTSTIQQRVLLIICLPIEVLSIYMLAVWDEPPVDMLFLCLVSILLLIGLTALYVYQLLKYTKLIKALKTLAPDQSEHKEVYCYKYTYLTYGRSRASRDIIGVCVHTVHGKYYYVFDSAIADGTKHDFKELYSGEHEFEIYKDTNIIKSFPAADKVLNTLSPHRFV